MVRAWMVVAAALAVAAPAQAVTGNPGGWGPLSGAGTCLVQTGTSGEDTCVPASAFVGVSAGEVTPDGAQLLVAGGTDPFTFWGHGEGYGGLAVLSRDQTAGTLAPLACVSSDGSDGDGSATCDAATALNGARAVAVTADGTGVAVAAAGADSITLFARDPASGKLTELGCLQQFVPFGGRCREAPVLEGVADVAFTPDGHDLLAISPPHNALVQFHMAADGTTEVHCVSATGTSGSCTRITQLGGLNALLPSPDGKQVYVRTGVGLAWLARDPDTGALTFGGCVDPAAADGACRAALRPQADYGDTYYPSYDYGSYYTGSHRLAISADGTSVYSVLGNLQRLTRDADGTLHPGGCYATAPPPEDTSDETDDSADGSDGSDTGDGTDDTTGTTDDGDATARAAQADPTTCAQVMTLSEPDAVALSPDGSSLLVGTFNGVEVLSRAADGTLTDAGCLSASDDRCGTAGIDRVIDLTVDPSGRFAYVFGPSTAVVLGQAPTVAPAGAARAVVACARACSGTLRTVTLGAGVAPPVLARGPAQRFRLRAGGRERVRIRPAHGARGRVVLVATPRRATRLGRATLRLGRIGRLSARRSCLSPGCRLLGGVIGAPAARAGRFRAFAVRWRHGRRAASTAVAVVDAAAGRVVFLRAAQGSGRAIAVPRLVLKPDGAAAWLSCAGAGTRCAAGRASEVQVHDALGTRLVTLAPHRVALRLALHGSTLSYEVGGQELQLPLR